MDKTIHDSDFLNRLPVCYEESDGSVWGWFEGDLEDFERLLHSLAIKHGHGSGGIG